MVGHLLSATTAAPPETPKLPRLLAITDWRARPERGFGDWVAGLVEAGVDGLQVREKALGDRSLLALVTEARRTFTRCLLVNGRADIALLAAADGVHLPSDGVPLAALRHRFGRRLLLGRSTHRADEVAQARSDGADYVLLGPIYDTPSKRPYGPPVGLDELCRAAGHGIPVLAVGGVTPRRLPEILARGAAGVAGISVFNDPAQTAELVAVARSSWAEWKASR